MKKPNPKIIRVRDKVKIINPEIFVRVGYPLTKEIVKQTIITEGHRKQIQNLVTQFVDGFNSGNFSDLLQYQDNIVFKKIEDDLAYAILKQKGFGGNERKIYTTLRPELKGKIVEVARKRVVKTGEYEASRTYYSYEGCPEYDQAYLKNEKSHVLLMCGDYFINGIATDLDEFEIEACNVEKIVENQSMKVYTEIRKEGEYLGPIDWSYDFLSHFGGYCCSEDDKKKCCEESKEMLKKIEKNLAQWMVTTDTGLPRMWWNKVIKVGMYDGWPYWKPVPSILTEGVFGPEWHSFQSITDILEKKPS